MTRHTLSFWADWVSERLGVHVPTSCFTPLARRLGLPCRRGPNGIVAMTEQDAQRVVDYLLEHGEHHASEDGEPYPSPQEIAHRAAAIREEWRRNGRKLNGFGGTGTPGIRNYVTRGGTATGKYLRFVQTVSNSDGGRVTDGPA